MVPLIITPTGGILGPDGEPVSVQRTFANARSTEFDALLLAGAPAVGADAYGACVSKADDDVAVAAGIGQCCSVPSIRLTVRSNASADGGLPSDHAGTADQLIRIRCG
ncbi:hypothetical protein [Streptomyces sp. NPDC059371]|uniref:hypothetical protein n=1 Tax=Streptomyces sp. NPDC059371 TaxID=3346812 RepID=UPI0036CA54B8